MIKLLIAIALLSVATSAANALDCEQIWFHNNSWCGNNGNYSCANYNAMCKPSCDGTEYMSCAEMPWCVVVKTDQWGATCRPNCEAITDSDACWSTTDGYPSCWYYNGKCMPACRYYSDNESFCLSSPFGSYCTWDNVNFRCNNDYSIATDFESCNKIYPLTDARVRWNFFQQKCDVACQFLRTHSDCLALGSRCQWYPASATDGDTEGRCMDSCSLGVNITACSVLTGCQWLSGSCKRTCSSVNVFPSKDDPKKYDTSQCDALDYCGVTSNNYCDFKKCSLARNRDDCDQFGYVCMFVEGSCTWNCNANNVFADIPCPTTGTQATVGTTLCQKAADGKCLPAECGNYTAFGRESCYYLGGSQFCMYYKGKCQKACRMYEPNQCNLEVCAHSNVIGCYFPGCNHAEQDGDAFLCYQARYEDDTGEWQFCSQRLNKCYANSCYPQTTKKHCTSLPGCAWLNNTYNFQGCFDVLTGLTELRSMWRAPIHRRCHHMQV